MNKLAVQGTQSFMGKEIPVVLGGFGPGKKCVSDKTVAEIHSQPEREIRRRITDNLKRFCADIDFIDLAQRVGQSHTLELLQNLGYSKQSITQAEHIYILSERGYAKLIKIMDTDLAWEIHDKLIDEYFELREDKKAQPLISLPSVNNAAKIIGKVLDEAGVKPEYKALTYQRLYRKAGVDLELDFLKTEKEFYLKEAIAKRLGVYSKNGKPHAQAIGAIIDQISVAEDEKVLTAYERNGHESMVYQYKEPVVERIQGWLEANHNPTVITSSNGNGYQVRYESQRYAKNNLPALTR